MQKAVYIVMIFLLALLVVNNELTDQYVAMLKGKTNLVLKESDSLYEEIKSKAKEHEVLPANAKIDRVWKAIPGYNGLKVDVEASYNQMKRSGHFNESKLIYKQVEPDVHLKDLPPAPIYKGNPEKPMISFIINVAWGEEYLLSILKTLKDNHVHATFFLEGRWVKNNPELARMIKEQGHEIGNHSYSHPDMKLLSAVKVREEIRKTNAVIKATTGETPVWFAPPSGSYRDEVVKIASEEKMSTILWSVDTIDWRKPSPDELINRVTTRVHNGAMILMHPTESTAKAMDQLIKEMKRKDLQIDTVTELLKEERLMNVPNQINRDYT